MSTEVRQLGPSDVLLMKSLLKTFAEAFYDKENYLSKPPNDTYLRRLLGGESFIAIVALKHGEVVGGIAAYELNKFEQERSEIYIYDLAVSSDNRREGIATSLILKLKEIAIERGAYAIFVQSDTEIEDAPAIALYSKLGSRESVLHFDIAV